jgi:hypothetical protein
MRLRSLLPLLLSLSLLGCPGDPPPQPNGTPGGGSGKTTETGTTPTMTTPTTTEGGASTAPWTVLPSAQVKADIYPMLQASETWPAPTSLTPIAELPADRQPDPSKVRVLKELVMFVVHPDLRPRDLDAAVGVDAQGRTFIRLGKERAQGSASIEVKTPATEAKFDFPVFTIVLDDPSQGAPTLDGLKQRVKNAVAPDLSKEMKDTHELEAHPVVNGGEKGIAAMAILDRNGYGGQFPYLYAYGTGRHLVITLQEVPHMSLGTDGGQPPR